MADALIVGAGPTGLTLGCELLKRGVAVRLIEQLTQAEQQSRALALHSRTLEIFERMGLLDAFLAQGRTVRQFNLFLNRQPLFSADFHSLNAPYPFILIVPQSHTEQILAHHFAKLGGQIERNTAYIGKQDEQALLQMGTKKESVSARWIFGCDGAHSRVRHSLNLPFVGEAFPETFALADVKMDAQIADDQFYVFFHPAGVCALIPLPEPSHFRIISLLSDSQALNKATLDIPFFHKHLDECTGMPFEINELLWTTKFTIHRRIVPQMRVGNTFLLGDAAHIHSPIGGQGLNTCVQDAFNLAWKIGLVHQNLSKESLLDSYEAERRPIAKAVLRHTTLGTRLVTTHFLKSLLLPIAAFLLKRPSLQHRLLKGLSELNVSYPHSPIIAYDQERHWQGPKPGERAPDALLANQTRLFSLLCHPDHSLLCFGVDFTSQGPFPKGVRSFQIPPSQAGEATAIYHAQKPCVYLIRPDGVIAYRSHLTDPAPLLFYLKNVFN